MKTTARITWALVSLGLLLSHCVSNSTADDDPTAAPPMTTPRPPAAGDAPQSTGAPPPPPDAASSSALGGAVDAPMATTVPAAAKPDAASVAPDAAAPQPTMPPPPPPTATTAKPPAAVVVDDAGIATTAKPPTPVVTEAPPTDAKVSTVAVLPKDDSPTVAVAVAAEPQPTPGPPTVPAGSAAVPVPSTAAGAAPTKPSGVAIVPASPAVTTVQTVEVVTTADSPGSKAIAPNPTPEDPGLTPPVPPAAGAKDDGVSGTPAPAVGADTTAKESADGHGTSGGNVIPTSLTALTTSPVKTTAAGSTRTGSDPSGSGTTTLPIVAVTEKKTGTTVSPLLRYHATPEAPAVSTASRTEPPITPTTSPTTTTPTITTTAVAVVESLTKTISFTKGRENKEEKDLGYVCTKLMEAMHAANCTMTVRQHRGKTSIDSVQIEGTVNPSLATRYYEEITKANAKKSGDNSTLIAILASCGALLVMIVGLAIYAHHRKPYNENQQHLTEELATVENGYHDNPTLEVMEVQPEMQEKKTMMALNGDFNDSWIVPIDNLPDEEDTHL